MSTIQWEIEKITPYPQNAKKHDKKQVKQVAASIKEFGFNQPIVVDKKGVIIVGHGRYEAAKLLDLKMVPVVQVELTDEQASASYRIADNKLNESPWDMQLVIGDLKLLSEPLFELTGFDGDLLVEPRANDDVIPENVPARSKLGDLYELGQHRVLCGDSTQQEAVSRLMDGKKADMVFTDPPYGVSYEAGLEDKASRMKAHRPMSRENTQIANDTIADDMGLYNFLLLAFQNIAANCKHGVYVCFANNRAMPFLNAWKDAGFHNASTIVWVKDRLVMGRGHYHYQYEPILYGWKEKNTGKWMGDRSQSNVWNLKRPSVNDLHPTMKPIELVEKALINSSGNEDIVFDPFSGSGSTLIACEKTGRICYGMELDPKYVDVIIKRWEDFTGNKAQKL